MASYYKGMIFVWGNWGRIWGVVGARDLCFNAQNSFENQGSTPLLVTLV
jgi:hypothetical protein